jgi:hypothetical protein
MSAPAYQPANRLGSSRTGDVSVSYFGGQFQSEFNGLEILLSVGLICGKLFENPPDI